MCRCNSVTYHRYIHKVTILLALLVMLVVEILIIYQFQIFFVIESLEELEEIMKYAFERSQKGISYIDQY